MTTEELLARMNKEAITLCVPGVLWLLDEQACVLRTMDEESAALGITREMMLEGYRVWTLAEPDAGPELEIETPQLLALIEECPVLALMRKYLIDLWVPSMLRMLDEDAAALGVSREQIIAGYLAWTVAERDDPSMHYQSFEWTEHSGWSRKAPTMEQFWAEFIRQLAREQNPKSLTSIGGN